jgi:hypothetical protein
MLNMAAKGRFGEKIQARKNRFSSEARIAAHELLNVPLSQAGGSYR